MQKQLTPGGTEFGLEPGTGHHADLSSFVGTIDFPRAALVSLVAADQERARARTPSFCPGENPAGGHRPPPTFPPGSAPKGFVAARDGH